LPQTSHSAIFQSSSGIFISGLEFCIADIFPVQFPVPKCDQNLVHPKTEFNYFSFR
jgi:hypothetical protein